MHSSLNTRTVSHTFSPSWPTKKLIHCSAALVPSTLNVDCCYRVKYFDIIFNVCDPCQIYLPFFSRLAGKVGIVLCGGGPQNLTWNVTFFWWLKKFQTKMTLSDLIGRLLCIDCLVELPWTYHWIWQGLFASIWVAWLSTGKWFFHLLSQLLLVSLKSSLIL